MQSSDPELFAPLQGHLRKPRTSLLRLMALGGVALALVLLVLAYLLLTGLLAFGLYCFALGTYDSVFESGSIMDIAALYIAPLLIGVVWLVFMIKPLFARPPVAPELVEVTREEAPEFFEFIEQLCRCIGAPLPGKVVVDVHANAEAILSRGLASFSRRDLTLRIGLPLVTAFTIQHLAQALSRELARFTQGIGMRLHYLIRQINGWLDRVVNGRDRLDLLLDRNAQRTELTIFLPLRVAQKCIWLSRKLLWIWLQAGKAVSGYFSRLAELDADVVGCKLIGSNPFIEGNWRAALLAKSTALAMDHASSGWKSFRLPDDLPAFAAKRVELFTENESGQIRQALEETPVKKLDTHPSWNVRVQQAARMGAAGIFHGSAPASRLFLDLPALCRRATRNYYEQERGLQIEDAFLIPTEESLQEYLAEVESARALDRYLGGVDTFYYPVAVHLDEIRAHEDQEELLKLLREATNRLIQSRESTAQALIRLKRMEDRLASALCARALVESGINIRARAYAVPGSGLDDISERIKELKRQIAPLEKTAADFSRDTKLRLTAALQLLHHRGRALGSPEATPMRDESVRLVETLGRLVSSLWLMHEVRRHFRAFDTLIVRRLTTPNPERLDKVLESLEADCRLALKKVKHHLYSAPYPFPHARGQIALETFLKTEVGTSNRMEVTYRECEAHLDRLFFLYNRTLARLAAIGEAVEAEVSSVRLQSEKPPGVVDGQGDAKDTAGALH